MIAALLMMLVTTAAPAPLRRISLPIETARDKASRIPGCLHGFFFSRKRARHVGYRIPMLGLDAGARRDRVRTDPSPSRAASRWIHRPITNIENSHA